MWCETGWEKYDHWQSCKICGEEEKQVLQECVVRFLECWRR